eukprot:404819_1
MLNHSSGSLSVTRREYLRKSQKDLMKECKKHNLATDGMKIDLIDRLLALNDPTYSKRVPIDEFRRTKSKKKKKNKNRHGRSYSIGVTLTSYHKIKKPKTSTSSTNIISNSKANTKTKSDKKVKPRINRAQSQISVTENHLKMKKKRNLEKYKNEIFPELRMDSLLKLNSIHLNENVATKTDEMVFVEHMSLNEINKLKVNQHIDFRIDTGYIYGAKIKSIHKNGKHKKYKIEYKNKDQNNQTSIYEVNINDKQIYRFAKYKSLSLRAAHRMNDLTIGSSIDINPRHIINEWMIGEVVEKDDNSGQILVEYSRNNNLYDYWIHADNTLEIAPYLSHYEYMQNIVDHYLDYEMKDSTDSEKEVANVDNNIKIERWDHDDVCKWFNDKFKKNLKKYDAFLEGIKTFCFYGSDLKQTNELTLRILGVNDENDRKSIMKEINKLCPVTVVRNGVYKNDQIEKQNKQYKSEIMQLKAEIIAMKSDKKTKSTKKHENKSVNKHKNTSTKKTVKSIKKNENINRMINIKNIMRSNKKNITKHNKKTEIEKTMSQFLLKTAAPISVAFVGHIDSGKSTLCGRLLYELNVFSTQKLQKLKKEAESYGKGSFMYAFYMDRTDDERSRGITLNYKYRSDLLFKTKSYSYQIIDIPGCSNLLKNAIKGISLADIGVLVIPANKHAFEASIYKLDHRRHINEGQTRQHANLLWLHGIKNIIVCVNKMDHSSVNYSQQRFNEIKHEMEAILEEIGFDVNKIPFIPISAWKGDNITKLSDNKILTKWYKENNTLYDAFENIINKKPPKRYYNNPLIMPIAKIINSGNTCNNNKSIICCGKIERGIIDFKKHKKVRFIPSNITGNLHSLQTNNKMINFAYCGLSIGCLINTNKIPKKGEIMILDEMNKYKDLPINIKRFCAEIIVRNHPSKLYSKKNRKKHGYIANVCIKNLCIPAEIVEIKWKIGKRTSNKKE